MFDHDDAPCGHHTDCDHDAESSPTVAAPLVSRRRLLTGAAMGLGALGFTRAVSAQTNVLSALSEPGQALEPAVRVPPTTSTTTTTVPPPTTTIPLADGEILFPVVAAEGDSVYVLDNFGDCRSGCSRLHEAVDIMADEGLALQAVANGVLTHKYVDSGLTYGAGHGWTLHDAENDVYYKYFHMASHEDGLEVGDEVEIGQIIGYVGETGTSGAGNPSDNFHCHFEYRPARDTNSYDGIAVDPFHLLQRLPHIDFQGE